MSFATRAEKDAVAGGSRRPAIPNRCYSGDIEFDAVTVSYSADLEPAVKELSFSLPAGKRLGLVGRSGSGKSTTLLALFRMIEMRSGTIRIDGRSIAEMPASQLRSQMTIVPQNPLVLAATIRENLDPEGRSARRISCGMLYTSAFG